MMYPLHDLQRRVLTPFAAFARVGADLLRDHDAVAARLLHAHLASLRRITKEYVKPPFGIATATVDGREVGVEEQVVATHPFCRLVRFARRSDDAAVQAGLDAAPRVLVVAPLSGHHATLLRDMVSTLLRDHDVVLTDWIDAREVPVARGTFGLDDYVALVRSFIQRLGADDLHVIAVCQPTVPVLGAVSLMAAADEPTPRTLTLMGGPVDARRSPTAVNRFATDRPLAWFEASMIHRVPWGHPGAGRAVYPGFLQLSAFVMMNPLRHAEAYQRYWMDVARGDDEAARAHERFYDEYNAVLDMDAPYYLDTVRTVFQETALARGTWRVAGERVRPDAVTETALLTIEGALDDISGLGQTEAAHALCSGIAASHKHHLVAEGCGHYGIFSGRRWREVIYPALRSFIRDRGRTS